jgi:hypothetical protein
LLPLPLLLLLLLEPKAALRSSQVNMPAGAGVKGMPAASRQPA